MDVPRAVYNWPHSSLVAALGRVGLVPYISNTVELPLVVGVLMSWA